MLNRGLKLNDLSFYRVDEHFLGLCFISIHSQVEEYVLYVNSHAVWLCRLVYLFDIISNQQADAQI